MEKVKVAVVGLGFGAEFIPIYQAYGETECVALCRRNGEKLRECADRFGVGKRYTDYHELLADRDIDAVHINTAIADHGRMSIEALQAGKHVACTVPMALAVEECREIARLERETEKVYMMMETSVYTREYFFFRQMVDSGELGRIQFLRGSHQQNMGLPGWPEYWYGLPPMYYPTHAIAPLSDAMDRPLASVRCLGSGRIREEYIPRYHSPFAAETAQFTLDGSDVACEVTRSLFDTARQYRESFDIYGSKQSFEWEQLEGEGPVVFSGIEDARRVEVPDTDGLLPPELAPFALRNRIVDDQHVSFIQGAGHGGSHPHLVREWIAAIREGRRAHVDSVRAANWTMAGLIAHESAMRGGAILEIPQLGSFQ